MSESDDNAKKAGAVGATGTVAGIGVAAAGSSAAAMTGTLATIGCRDWRGGGCTSGGRRDCLRPLEMACRRLTLTA